MSKMPEPYTLTEQLHRAAQRSAYYGDGCADLLASAAEALEDHDRDVAHAVALERERIAKWLEQGPARLVEPGALALDIRNGAHNPATAPGAGQDGDGMASGTLNDTDVTSGAQAQSWDPKPGDRIRFHGLRGEDVEATVIDVLTNGGVECQVFPEGADQ